MVENERWFIKNRKGDPVELSRRLGISVQLSRMLISRSICDEASARAFLNPSFDSCYAPSLLKDMDAALGILESAVAEDLPALVIGDYDVDGVMGVYILCEAFARRFSNVMHYIPHRVDDGYGISSRIVEYAHDAGVRLIVTCDNGIAAHEAIALARSLGMRVIITDHHDVPDGQLPEADAVIDPKRPDCGYPFKDLCGAAVAYKLAIAFTERLGVDMAPESLEMMFCFVAIATVCDIVDLLDENRAIVTHGLRLLNKDIKNVGLRELVDVCGLSQRELTTYNIGHVLGPCLNATGRLDSAELSYRLFAEQDRLRARSLALCALDLNRRRQEITAEALESACEAIAREDLDMHPVIVAYLPGMHESVAGIVAGKLKDRFARPAVVLADAAQGCLKGSGRSIEGYNLLDAVSRVGGLLVKFGGHAMAIGLTVEPCQLGLFRDELIRTCELEQEDLVPRELIDVCVEADEISADLVRDIKRLEPFGRGNMRPLLAVRGLGLDYAALIGAKRNVVKIKLASRDRLHDAVYFGDPDVFVRVLGLEPDDMGMLVGGAMPRLRVDVIFYPEINEYNGCRRMQLVVRSIRPSQPAEAALRRPDRPDYAMDGERSWKNANWAKQALR